MCLYVYEKLGVHAFTPAEKVVQVPRTWLDAQVNLRGRELPSELVAEVLQHHRDAPRSYREYCAT